MTAFRSDDERLATERCVRLFVQSGRLLADRLALTVTTAQRGEDIRAMELALSCGPDKATAMALRTYLADLWPTYAEGAEFILERANIDGE